MARFEVTAPDGNKYEITAPDDATDEQALQYAQENYSSVPAAEKPQTTLFSKAGAETIAQTARTALPMGVMQEQLRTHESVKAAWEKDPARAAAFGHTEEHYKEAVARIPELQTSLAEIEKDTTKPDESRPLGWVKGATASIVQNLPGLLASIVSRGAGAPAALPALHGAKEMATASKYTEARKADVPIREANIAAEVSGATEVGFEIAPIGFILNKLGKVETVKFIAGLLGKEIPTELATTAANNVTDWAVLHPEMSVKDFAEKLGHDLVDTAIVTTLSVPVTAGIATSIVRAGKMAEGIDPAAEKPGAELGTNNAPIGDLPTIPLESAQIEAMVLKAAETDPTTITEAQSEENRRIVDDFIKKQKSPPSPTAAQDWQILSDAPSSPVGDIGDLGASRRQAGNAVNYINPNQGFREDRQFSFGPEEAIGLTPRQAPIKPGVYGLGIPSDDRPGMYLGPLVETYAQWQKEWLPEATIIVSNEQLDTDSALGNHFSSRPGQHLIVPAVLRSPSKGLGAYNVNTQASAFYVATHEFGHAFIADKLFEGMDPEVVGNARKQSRLGLIDEAGIASFPEERQALVREFNALKGRVLDGSLTAQEFLDHWIGPAKAGRKTFLSELKVSPVAPAKQLVNALAQRAVEKSRVVNDQTAATLKQQYVEDILSIDEYGAEQVARFAYKHHWDASTPLGRLFEKILSGLRGFFIQQKKEGLIAPGVEFNKWMEGVGKISRAMEGKTTLAEAKALHKKMPKEAATAVPPTPITPTIAKSGFNPQDNLFNTPALKDNRTYAWRSMGAAEFAKLAAGQQEYTGAKAATKGNYLAGTPESAAQFGGKGKYLVEFGKVTIAGDEGLAPGSKANKSNVSNVWRHDGQNWIEQPAPWMPEPAKAKPKLKVKRVQHNVNTDAAVPKRRVAQSLMVHLVRGGVIERSDPVYEMMTEMIEAHEWDDFNEMYFGLTKKTIKWSLDEGGELKASVDLRRLLDLVGHKMYAGGLGNTILKETLQNSVDATLAEMKVHGKGFEPKIDFKVDGSTRTITVTDNGKGMTLQEVATKFLTLAAAGKEAGSAGGFGMAKAAFLFGPRDIALETTRAGVTTKLVASQEDLLGQKDLRKGASSQQTGRPNGTKLTVTLPREYRAESGKMEPVSMPYGLHTGPMIAPVKVTYNGEALPIGRNFPLKNYWKPITVKFDWGTIDLYLESEKADYKTFNVLSQGVPQFQKYESYETKVKLKHNLLIDVKPSVTATHTLYPFNLSREGFKPSIQETDIKALDKYLELIAIKEKTMEAKAAFSRIKQMSLISSDSTAKTRPTGKSFKKNVLDELEAAFAGQTVGIAHGDLKVNDKVVFRASEKEKYTGSMKAPEVNFADADLELTEDPSKPLLHNNTNFDPVEWGEKQGLEDAGTLMAKLGTAVVEFRNLIAEAPSLGGHKEDILKGYAGISLDKNYLGVNLNSPYTAMFLNPLTPQFDPRNTAEMVGLFKYALVHEAAHYISRGTNHGDDFVSMEAQLFTEIESLGGLAQFEESLRTIVDLHFPTLEALRNEFAKSSIKNLGESIGEAIRRTKVRPGKLREDGGEGRGQDSSHPLPTGTIDPRTGAVKDSIVDQTFYHWTDQTFEDFSKTRDIGFHFGSKEAAHARMDSMKDGPYEPWDMPDFGNIRPVKLEVENPLHIGEDLNVDWDAPEALIERLEKIGVATREEADMLESLVANYLDTTFGPEGVFHARAPLWEQGVVMYDYFGPVRRFLEDKGYDGLTYDNIATDDKSVVAFRPQQIRSVYDTDTLYTAKEVMPLLAKDPNLWAHITKKDSAKAIRKEGFKTDFVDTAVGQGIGRDFEPVGISLTRDKEVIEVYTRPESYGGKRFQEGFGPHEILLVRVTPKKVLDLEKRPLDYTALMKKMGQKFDPEEMNIPDFFGEEEIKALETGKNVTFPSWQHNMLAMMDVLGPDFKTSGEDLGIEIRDKLRAQGYDAVLYPDEIRVLDMGILEIKPAPSRGEDRTPSLKGVTTESDWKQDKFLAPSFKAWFGDWERDPEGSSVVRIGALKYENAKALPMKDLVSAPLVLYSTLERLRGGDRTFHASTPAGQQYAESNMPNPVKDVSLVPVVLNIRNPFIVENEFAPVPTPEQLQAQGHDGIIYRNDLNGDFSYVVFSPEQIKTVLDRQPHGVRGQWRNSLDFDQSTPEGHALSRLHGAIKNYVADPMSALRSLRSVLPGLHNMMQLQQISQLNPGLGPYTMLRNLNSESVGYKSTQQHRPNADIDFWKRTSEREFHKLGELFYKQQEGKVHWLDMVEKKLILGDRGKKILKENGLDVDASERNAELVKHFENVMNSKLMALNETERVLRELLAIRFAADERVFKAAADEVSKKIEVLRHFPFHPQGHFGNYLLVIRQKDKVGYPIVWKQAFESAQQRDTAFNKALAKKSADQIVERKELSDTEYVLQALPAEFLETVASELDLTDIQTNKLNEIMQPVKDARLLGKIERAKLGLVGGGSTDAYRSYAAYMWHLTNAQMKLKYRRSFGLAIEEMRNGVVELARSPDSPEYYKALRILRSMEGIREYVMNPPYEMQMARSFISVAYLWGGMGTAAINSLGLMTTLSHITSKYGVIGGTAKFATGVWDAISSITSKEKLDPQVGQFLDRAEKDGTLSQSFAYHLAGSAHESRMWQIPGHRPFDRAWQKTVDIGMLPFRMVELGTRRIAFMIAIKEHLANPALGPEEAYKKAVAAVGAQQNAYDRGNRVPFMRGAKGRLGWTMPMATIFLSFPQHMAFHTLGGYELGQRRETERAIRAGELPASAMPSKAKWLYGYTMRLWAMFFFLGGSEGLPFSENLMDIAEAFWKKYGSGKPIRQNLREFIQSLGQDPYLWTRGLGHNVVGFDIARRIGFGRVVPGTDQLGRSTQAGPVETIGNIALDMMGVTGGTIKFILNMTIGQKPAGEAMRRAPGAIGNFWNAYEWYRYGVRGPHGGVIAFDPESRQPQDLAMIAGKALGVNPTEVSEKRELRWEQYDRQQYYSTMQTKIKKSAWEAEWKNDPEIRKDAREAMKIFNDRLPDLPDYRRLRLTEKHLQEYIREMRRKKREEEANRPPSKKLRGAYEDIRRSWDAPEDKP